MSLSFAGMHRTTTKNRKANAIPRSNSILFIEFLITKRGFYARRVRRPAAQRFPSYDAASPGAGLVFGPLAGSGLNASACCWLQTPGIFAPQAAHAPSFMPEGSTR